MRANPTHKICNCTFYFSFLKFAVLCLSVFLVKITCTQHYQSMNSYNIAHEWIWEWDGGCSRRSPKGPLKGPRERDADAKPEPDNIMRRIVWLPQANVRKGEDAAKILFSGPLRSVLLGSSAAAASSSRLPQHSASSSYVVGYLKWWTIFKDGQPIFCSIYLPLSKRRILVFSPSSGFVAALHCPSGNSWLQTSNQARDAAAARDKRRRDGDATAEFFLARYRE